MNYQYYVESRIIFYSEVVYVRVECFFHEFIILEN